MQIPPETFVHLAKHLINQGNLDKPLDECVFQAHFKLTLLGTAQLWSRLLQYNPQSVTLDGVKYTITNYQPNHLLWLLHYLKTYVSEDVAASFSGVSNKTHRKYV